MPVERRPISVSQLSELLGVDPARFVAIERTSTGWCVVTDEGAEMQTRGTVPQLTTGKGGKKLGGKKKGC
jgi:hypothetical protein